MKVQPSLKKKRDWLSTILEKFPEAVDDSVYIPGFGVHTCITSKGTSATGIYATYKPDNGEPMLTVCDTVEIGGSNAAVFDRQHRFVHWLPVLLAFKKINPSAYNSLLQIIVSMGDHSTKLSSIHMDAYAVEEYCKGMADMDRVMIAELIAHEHRYV